MTTLHDDYISDLQDSLTSPLLLEIQKKHILQLKQDVPEFSEVVTYHSIYNAELPHNDKTNIITINAEAGKNTQIFSTIYHLIGDELRNKLLIDSALKFSIFFAAQGVGDFLGDVMNSRVSDTFKKTFSWLNESLSDNPLADTAINSVVDKPVDIVSGQIEDLAVKGADKANDKQTLGRKLYLSDTAQAEMRALATQMSEEQTPHQVMQFLLKLLIALGTGAPKLIVINNPFNLDAASIALLSLYFSHAKDAKQSVTKTEGDKAAATHPGVSVLFNYTEQQPFDALPENDTKQKLTRLRHMVQRYGMLEKPGASIPVPAIRATTFVGRTAELRQLITEHEKFIKDCHANESQQVTSQWTLVKGEPGTGKTALVKKHLDTIFTQADALTSSQVRLTLLNQTGHSSEITGLASLQHAIQLELVRLTEEYKKKLGYFERKIKDKCIEWENAKAQFGQIHDATSSYKTQYEALKNNRVAALKGIKKAVKFISDLSGFGSMHDGATSAWNASAINQHQSQSVDALKNEDNKNAKQEQFDSLFIAIKELKNVSKFIDAKSEKSPILLFVDDLQWIDELSSEFILTQLATHFSTEILFTARYSDSNTSYKLALKNQQHSPYKLALFDAIKLNTTVSEANATDCQALIPDSIKINAQILIEGMNKRTLQALIEQAYAINDDNTSSLIAEKIISVLTEQEITADTQVVTLFAVEALNLISDERFYQRKAKENLTITPLFTQIKKGVFRLNVLSTAQVNATIENVFARLHDTHQHAFTHSNAQNNGQTYFTLSSYAVMEERLLIIHDYFSEGDIQYGDAAVFSLQLSALIGAPFDSALVAHLIEKLTAVDVNEYQALTALKAFLQQEAGCSLKEEHVEILEEAFEILRRLQPNRHHYRHSLFNVFLRQQLNVSLGELMKQETHPNALDEFFSFTHKEMNSRFQAEEVKNLPAAEVFEYKLYTQSANVALLELAFKHNKDKWAEGYTLSIDKLANTYRRVDSVVDAIELLKECLVILKALYTDQPARWAEGYTASLNNLAISYNSIGRALDAIALQQESLAIRKALYAKWPAHWAKGYAISLNNLAFSYSSVGRAVEAIALQKESLIILAALYAEQPARWAEGYTVSLNSLASSYKSVGRVVDAITLERESLAVRKALYVEQPARWAEGYTVSLNNLASSYKGAGRVVDAITLEQESLAIRKALYVEQPARWAEAYTNSLNNLVSSYSRVGRVVDAIKLGQESLAILQALYTKLPARWAEAYTQSLNNLAFSYSKVGRTVDTIALLEKSLAIRQALYAEQPARWAEAYTVSLSNLAHSYESADKIVDAIALRQKCLAILKALYTEQPARWTEDYTASLNNLAHLYESVDRTADALVLLQEALAIRQALYAERPARWAEAYTQSLNNLAWTYESVDRTVNAMMLLEESLEILKALYTEQPARWAEAYTNSLNSLAYCYKRSDRAVNAIALQQESLSILKALYAEQPARWAK
ncbi:tetratricopeptide repeat protein, partial [Shewanella sp. 0m-11]